MTSPITPIESKVVAFSPNSPIVLKGPRGVSFCRLVRTRLVLHFRDYSNQEKETCWYSRAEINAIRAEAVSTAKQLQSGDSIDESECCFRGLEFLRAEGRKQRINNRCRSRNAVFDEQDRQADCSVWDDDAMSSIYTECCEISVLAAIARGVSDERALVEHAKPEAKTIQPVQRQTIMMYSKPWRQVR